ncbi:MAG: hypothetical protein H6738_18785 [Alphaproteobacteria bacterium]|nr:hypothetical protein [Alphaproteobacteria bacterium]MCB9698834.1 hypothetical protein [Alphaproteobacteria bacterium]
MTTLLLLALGMAHARTEPTLVVPDLAVGSGVVVHFYGGLPGETAYLAGGTGLGAGPCPPALGGQCLDLLGARLVGTAVTDADGHATFLVQVPAAATPGTPVALQVAVPRGVGGADSLLTDAHATSLRAGGTWYDDVDGDGFGDPATGVVQAQAPAGTVGNGADCDDAAPTTHPGAPEILGDSIDQDCDGDTVPRIDCVGVPVPGAYATVQGAVDALRTVGGTICVGEGTFTGGLVVDATTTSPLEIVGVSREHTQISGLVDIRGRTDTLVRLRGMTLPDGVLVRHGLFSLEDLTVRSSSGSAIDVHYQQIGGSTVDLTVDRCDLDGRSYGVSVSTNFSWPNNVHLEVRNSVVSGVSGGVRFYANDWNRDLTVGVYGSTLVGSGAGRGFVVEGPYGADVSYANNLITGFTTGTEIASPNAVTNSGDNAYWDNGAAFGQSAIPQPGDVFSDCALDGLWPPSPAPGTACIDAGRTAPGSDQDFWGRPRVDGPDIGAVEW